MALGDLFGSSEQPGLQGKRELFSRFTPEIQSKFNKIIADILGQYQQGAFDFAPIAEQARTQFQQRTVPSIAERFTAMGGQRSSAFGQQLGAAGAGLEESLAALGSQYGLQQQRLLQNLLALGAQEPVYLSPQPTTGQSIAQAVGGGLGQALPLLGLGLLGGL